MSGAPPNGVLFVLPVALECIKELQLSLAIGERMLRKWTIRVGVPIVAIAVGAVVLSGCAPAEKTAEAASTAEETPTATETATPELPAAENDPEITPENEAQRLSELQFSAEMSPEEMGEHYTEVINSWIMAGATPEMWYEWLDAGLPDEIEYAEEIAENNREVYATALFGENYKSTADGKLLKTIDNIVQANSANIIAYIRTYGDKNNPNTNTENVEPWHAENTNLSVKVESQTDTGLSLVVRQESNPNADKTMYEGDSMDSRGHIAETHIDIDTTAETPYVASLSIVDIN